MTALDSIPMQTPGLKRKRLPPTLRRRAPIDAVALFAYLWIVYGWSLTIYPMGRDFAHLASRGQAMPFVAAQVFAWEIDTFGANLVPYHLVNMVILYATMICLYFLANFCIQGPPWLGVLAACYFMGNPVHAEALLNLSGVSDLIPCLSAVLALMLYVMHANYRRTWIWTLAFVTFAWAVLPYRENMSLIAVLLLYEGLVAKKGPRAVLRITPFIAVSALALSAHLFAGDRFGAEDFDAGRMFAPIYFFVYPIGFLPETASQFHRFPALGWLAAGVIAVLLFLIHRKARRNIVLFGLFAALAVRFGQGGRLIDPVHMVGGGQLLLANALFNIGLSGLFLRMMEHPKWRNTIITATTLGSLFFFGIQIRSDLAWRAAAREVRSFQQEAALALRNGEGSIAEIGVLPDYQYYRGAPVQLSDAIRYDTLFSAALPHRSLLPLNIDASHEIEVRIKGWSPRRGAVRIENVRLVDVWPWPYTIGRSANASVVLEMLDRDDSGFTLAVRPTGGSALPDTVLPARAPFDGD